MSRAIGSINILLGKIHHCHSSDEICRLANQSSDSISGYLYILFAQISVIVGHSGFYIITPAKTTVSGSAEFYRIEGFYNGVESRLVEQRRAVPHLGGHWLHSMYCCGILIIALDLQDITQINHK